MEWFDAHPLFIWRMDVLPRAAISTDGRERECALELTPIFSQWRLWINGELRQSVGFGDDGPG